MATKRKVNSKSKKPLTRAQIDRKTAKLRTRIAQLQSSLDVFEATRTRVKALEFGEAYGRGPGPIVNDAAQPKPPHLFALLKELEEELGGLNEVAARIRDVLVGADAEKDLPAIPGNQSPVASTILRHIWMARQIKQRLQRVAEVTG